MPCSQIFAPVPVHSFIAYVLEQGTLHCPGMCSCEGLGGGGGAKGRGGVAWSTDHAGIVRNNLHAVGLTSAAGVVENILGRVLDAFQVRMGSLLGSSLSKGLAENTALAVQMAAEPAALLATYPQAFFVGKANETMEGFVKAVTQAGFGSGDDTGETAVLAQVAQV